MLLVLLHLHEPHNIVEQVPPKYGRGTEHSSTHGPRETTDEHVLPSQVESRDANLGSKVSHRVGGEPDRVMVNTVHLPPGCAEVVDVAKGRAHFKVLLPVSYLRVELTRLHGRGGEMTTDIEKMLNVRTLIFSVEIWITLFS